MIWNYRVIRKVEKEEYTFGIHEVYYKEDGTVEGWTENHGGPFGETVEELQRKLELMKTALDKPVLREIVGLEEMTDEQN